MVVDVDNKNSGSNFDSLSDLQKFWDKKLHDIDDLHTISLSARPNLRANDFKSPLKQGIDLSLRWHSPEKQGYYHRLYEFNRDFNFKKRFKERWKLIKHIVRLTSYGYSTTVVQRKVNKILNIRFHRDSYSRLLRETIVPLADNWWRHKYWESVRDEELGDCYLGVRPPDRLRRPGRPASYYAAITKAQKSMAIANITALRESKRPPLP
jgi:hypothetical protein